MQSAIIGSVESIDLFFFLVKSIESSRLFHSSSSFVSPSVHIHRSKLPSSSVDHTTEVELFTRFFSSFSRVILLDGKREGEKKLDERKVKIASLTCPFVSVVRCTSNRR